MRGVLDQGGGWTLCVAVGGNKVEKVNKGNLITVGGLDSIIIAYWMEDTLPGI